MQVSNATAAYIGGSEGSTDKLDVKVTVDKAVLEVMRDGLVLIKFNPELMESTIFSADVTRVVEDDAEGEINTPKVKGPEALKLDDPSMLIETFSRFVIVHFWMSIYLSFPVIEPESFHAMWLKSNTSADRFAGLVDICDTAIKKVDISLTKFPLIS